jgi:hypothetical protein
MLVEAVLVERRLVQHRPAHRYHLHLLMGTTQDNFLNAFSNTAWHHYTVSVQVRQEAIMKDKAYTLW